MNLTKRQREILHEYKNLNRTQKEIAQRRGISQQAVAKVIKKCKEKGLITSAEKQEVVFSTPVPQERLYTTTQEQKTWRAHNLHYKITPFYFFERYKRHVGSIIKSGGWTLKCHSRTLEVYLSSDRHFSSFDRWETSRLAGESLRKVLELQEHRLGFALFKDGHANIEAVNGHLALEDPETAEAVSEDFLRIRGSDGKFFLQLDRSKGFLELEYVHPKDHFQDADALEPLFSSAKDYFLTHGKPLDFGEIARAIEGNTANISGVVQIFDRLFSARNDPKPVVLGRADYIG